MEEIRLDKLDFKLLSELDRNCRQSIQQLARKLRTSRDVISYRIKRLEELKVVEGYYSLIDPSKLGYIFCRFYLKLKGTTSEIEREIINYLANEKTTFLVYKTQAAWDIAAGFIVKSAAEFDIIWREFQKKFQPYVSVANLATIYELVLYNRKYLTDEKNREYRGYETGNSTPVKLSEKELMLVKLIAKNAKASLLQLAKQLSITPATVGQMLRRLEADKVILAYKAVIDFNKLDYHYYKIDLYLEDVNKRSAIQEFARRHPNVVYEDRTIGGSDVEFDLELRNEEALYAFVEEIKKNFGGIIRSFHYYHAIKSYKYSYVPE